MTRKAPEYVTGSSGPGKGLRNRDHISVSTATTSITIRLDMIELGALDLWIADQPDPKPSREEASGMLINWALAKKSDRNSIEPPPNAAPREESPS